MRTQTFLVQLTLDFDRIASDYDINNDLSEICRSHYPFVSYQLADQAQWWVRVTHNQSGEILYDGPQPFDGEIEDVTDYLMEKQEIRRADSDGYIPPGCGEYCTEVRAYPDYDPNSCWEALDWFAA